MSISFLAAWTVNLCEPFVGIRPLRLRDMSYVPSSAGPRALASPIGQTGERALGIGTGRLPHVDLIAVEARAQRRAHLLRQHLNS